MEMEMQMASALRSAAAIAIVSGSAVLLSACAPPAVPISSTPAAALHYVAFGDSWPYGAHCGSCDPFPELYADALEDAQSAPVEFTNLVTNGGTSLDLRDDVESNESTRAAIADADVIIISTGANDLEPGMTKWLEGTCGGDDQLDCFREIADAWHANFDAILTEVDALRGERPTAVRIITNSNEFLSDPGLIDTFGADFGLSGGAAITALHHDALCAAAETHDAMCVDLRPVLNGPDYTAPADVNTQESMQAVADALLASGLGELD